VSVVVRDSDHGKQDCGRAADKLHFVRHFQQSHGNGNLKMTVELATKPKAKLIDGVAVAKKIRNECRERVESLIAQCGIPPGLAVIVVGSNPASQVYVKNKIRACESIGIKSFRFDYPPDVDQDEVIDLHPAAQRRSGGARHPGSTAFAGIIRHGTDSQNHFRR
jgi:Tetrahydrofolate dehydrogenase/cyclohydrolase, catalytic domain